MERDEQLRVLCDIEKGLLTPEDAMQLLDETGVSQQGSRIARWFVIEITDLDTGKNKLTVRLPIDLVSVGARLGARYVPEGARFDLEHVLDQVQAGYSGRVFEATDDREHEYVQIYVE